MTTLTWPCFLTALVATVAVGCSGGEPPLRDGGPPRPFDDAGNFFCVSLEARACIDNVHYRCVEDGEFLSTRLDDCDDGDRLCLTDLGCVDCVPETRFCDGLDVRQCNAEGSDSTFVETCNIQEGFGCRRGECVNLCEFAQTERSYEGCEFYAVDLDNAAIEVGRDAAAQQYAVVVSNSGQYPTDVWVERNNAPFGDEPEVEEVDRLPSLLPGGLHVFELDRREVDGSSSNLLCTDPFSSEECPVNERCFCAQSGRCTCRLRENSNGLNDGTHSATSSNAYRVRADLPIIAYQFNPRDNVDVFSNDASLLLPTSAIGSDYAVIGWPQTIADSIDPNEDLDPTRDDEDLRAALTIVGTRAGTRVDVTFGQLVRNVMPMDGEGPAGRAGQTWSFDIGPFDVVNIETGGFNADFTGTTVVSTGGPVSVFTGSEASDVPRFDTVLDRECCADHLEEQVFPRNTLGSRFFVGHMPSRAESLNAAFEDPGDSVGTPAEPEFVRILAVNPGLTRIRTTLPGAVQFNLDQGESRILRSEQDFEIISENGAPIAVLQALPSQQVLGIPSELPGGDPAIVAVPPVQQYRQEYVFLVPELYGFDYLVITAPRGAPLLLDEAPLPSSCEVGPADGIPRVDGDAPPEYVVYRCQLGFPTVITDIDDPDLCEVDPGPLGVCVQPNVQDDGVHTLRAPQDVEIGLVVYGFDRFVSYAYAGGLDLDPID
ncbi:MAG: IgGFc-binding protein [Sandaracinaceae bacterium]